MNTHQLFLRLESLSPIQQTTNVFSLFQWKKPISCYNLPDDEFLTYNSKIVTSICVDVTKGQMTFNCEDGDIVITPLSDVDNSNIKLYKGIQSTTLDQPDWESAPNWANYIAHDSNGEVYWYATEPTLDINTGEWGTSVWYRSQYVKTIPLYITNWRKSLRRRPGIE